MIVTLSIYSKLITNISYSLSSAQSFIHFNIIHSINHEMYLQRVLKSRLSPFDMLMETWNFVDCSIARARSSTQGKNKSGKIRVKGESSERSVEV